MNATQLGLETPFVAFVGAGASAIEPSHLPTWSAFNRLVLDALCSRLDQFSRERQPTVQMLQTMLARRDTTRFLTPDFQAQLIEEEVGADYFAVWQSLPATAFSPAHAALAVLAGQGRLAAIVTTNFDTLIESALVAHGVPFSVHHDAASFAALAAGGASALPVVKIHGSIDDPGSLVDTLRQRLAGRPAALQRLLDGWLHEHRWLFLGYSGADFSHAPNHLNLLALAQAAAGFVFVQRPGTVVEPGVQRLLDAYGPAKALALEADLAGFLPAAFDIDPLSLPASGAVHLQADDVLAAARQGVQDWVGRLGAMAVVGIIVALLRSWGDEAAALWLLRKTWKSYRSPADTRGASYHRYNHLFGVMLRDAGFLFSRVALADDMGNLGEWKAAADLNGYEYLARSRDATAHPASAAALAALLAYRGDVGRGMDLLEQATAAAGAAGDALAACDVALDAAVVFDIVQVFGPTIELLQQARQRVVPLGDVLRAARLALWLGRFMTYAGRLDEALPWLDEAATVAAQFGQAGLSDAAAAARGVWLSERGRHDEALAVLQPLAERLREADAVPLFSRIDLARPDAGPTGFHGISPLRVRVLLDLNRAAMLGGQGTPMQASLTELEVLTADPYSGYRPAYCAAYVQCLAVHGTTGARELIDELLVMLERLGSEQGNPWPAQAAVFFRQQLGGADPTRSG